MTLSPEIVAMIEAGPQLEDRRPKGPKQEIYFRIDETTKAWATRTALAAAEWQARKIEVLEMQNAHLRACLDNAINRLVSIHSFLRPDAIVTPDGRRFEFCPKDDVIRDAWEGLSHAIRNSEAAILANAGLKP